MKYICKQTQLVQNLLREANTKNHPESFWEQKTVNRNISILEEELVFMDAISQHIIVRKKKLA